MRACSRPAYTMSLQGRYQEAARMFSKHGQVERAMEMFTDLRQFAEAKAWAEAWARSNSGAAGPLYAAKHEQHLAWDLCGRIMCLHLLLPPKCCPALGSCQGLAVM